MGRQLIGYVPVHVADQTFWYGPGDDVPAEHAKMIGQHAWVGEGDADDDQFDQLSEPIDKLTVKQLQARAEAFGIDLGGATKKADIIKALDAAPVEDAAGTGSGDPGPGDDPDNE